MQARAKQCGCRTWAGSGASLRLSHCPGEQSLLLPDSKGLGRAGSGVRARSPGLGEWRRLGEMGGFHSPLPQGCSWVRAQGALHPKNPQKIHFPRLFSYHWQFPKWIISRRRVWKQFYASICKQSQGKTLGWVGKSKEDFSSCFKAGINVINTQKFSW